MTTAERHTLENAPLRDRVEYRLYLAIAFLIFLPAALIGRVMPRKAGRARVSVFDEAMTAARGAAPLIFMG
jgi:hypothetical protein